MGTMTSTWRRAELATDFSSPAQCLEVLRGLNPTAIEETLGVLDQLLEGMAVAQPDPLGHLQVLEEMRPSLEFVLQSVAKRYASEPVLPDCSEVATFSLAVRMWELAGNNYAFVAQRAASTGDPKLQGQLAEKRALIAHRRMQCLGNSMVEYFRAKREMPEGKWRDMHALYLSAERAGVAAIRVPDQLNEVWGAQSPLECYVATLLIDAANPYGRTPRELSWLVRWAARFAPYCLLESDLAQIQSASFVQDTASDHGFRPSGALLPNASLRTLNTVQLAAHIKAMVGKLKKGVPASKLGLGDDCVQPACARLLVSLYRPWGLAAAGRKFQRRAQRGQVRVCVDLEAMAFYLTGKEYVAPDQIAVRHLDFASSEALFALGGQVASTETASATIDEQGLQLGHVKESWDIQDQSVAGLRLMRRDGKSRLAHRQLIGVDFGDANGMLLGEICWVQCQRSGALQAGVSMMPGRPVLAPVRLMINGRSASDHFRIGFLIPCVPSLKTEATLIVPVGWFMPERRVTVHGNTPWIARLTSLVSRGGNFDRVSYVREEQPDWPESES